MCVFIPQKVWMAWVGQAHARNLECPSQSLKWMPGPSSSASPGHKQDWKRNRWDTPQLQPPKWPSRISLLIIRLSFKWKESRDHKPFDLQKDVLFCHEIHGVCPSAREALAESTCLPWNPWGKPGWHSLSCCLLCFAFKAVCPDRLFHSLIIIKARNGGNHAI